MKSKKICILTSVHPAFDVRIYHREARSLCRAGYDVTLIAQNERDEVVDGVRIIALPKPANRFWRMVSTCRVFRIAYKQKADAYHFHDPELLPVGLLLKVTTKGKVIYDVHEDYPEQILTKYWLPRIARRPVSCVFNLVEKSASHWLDCTIAVTDGLADKFKKGKIVTVMNYPTVDDIPYKSEFGYGGPTLIYAGRLEEDAGISEIVQSMEYVDSSNDIKLILYGRFSPEYYQEEIKGLRGYNKVMYMGWIEPERLWQKMAQASAAIVCYHPVPNAIAGQPRKLFEYMAAGLPVIASNFPLWKSLVEENNCGMTVNPLDPREIARAIKYLISHPEEAKRMGENGRKAVLEKYNWETENEKLLNVYANLMKGV